MWGLWKRFKLHSNGDFYHYLDRMIRDNNLNHVSFSPLTPVIKVCFHHVHPHVDLIDLYSITLVALVQLAHACLELLQHRTSPDHCNCSRVSKTISGESPTEYSSFVCLRLCSSSKATLTPGALRATSSSVLRRRPERQQQAVSSSFKQFQAFCEQF